MVRLFVGTNNFRVDILKSLNKSKPHFSCVNAKLSKEKQAAAPMPKILVRLNEELVRVKRLVNTAYYTAKEEVAFAKFPGLCKLQEKKGLDLLIFDDFPIQNT